MRKIFLGIIFLNLLFFGSESCKSKKNIPSTDQHSSSKNNAEENSSRNFAVPPNHFRVDAILISQPKTDSLNQLQSFTLLIHDVLARGSSLTYMVSSGDTIVASFPLMKKIPPQGLTKGDNILALIEERIQLNADKPLFFMKDFHKK